MCICMICMCMYLEIVCMIHMCIYIRDKYDRCMYLVTFAFRRQLCQLQHAATRCSTLQHAATRCNKLQHFVTRCNTLLHSATRCNTLQISRNSIQEAHLTPGQLLYIYIFEYINNILQHTHWNGLQHAHISTFCITLQHTATLCNTFPKMASSTHTFQYCATHCNALPHSTTHCSALQHTVTLCNTHLEMASRRHTLPPGNWPISVNLSISAPGASLPTMKAAKFAWYADSIKHAMFVSGMLRRLIYKYECMKGSTFDNLIASYIYKLVCMLYI